MSKFEELELIEAGQDRTAARTATEGHSLAGGVRRQEGRPSVWVVGRMLPLLERHLPSFPIRFGRRATAASFSLRQTE